MVEDVLGVRAFSNFRKAAVKQFTSLKVLVNLKKAIKGSPAYSLSQKDGVAETLCFQAFQVGLCTATVRILKAFTLSINWRYAKDSLLSQAPSS